MCWTHFHRPAPLPKYLEQAPRTRRGMRVSGMARHRNPLNQLAPGLCRAASHMEDVGTRGLLASCHVPHQDARMRKSRRKSQAQRPKGGIRSSTRILKEALGLTSAPRTTREPQGARTRPPWWHRHGGPVSCLRWLARRWSSSDDLKESHWPLSIRPSRTHHQGLDLGQHPTFSLVGNIIQGNEFIADEIVKTEESGIC